MLKEHRDAVVREIRAFMNERGLKQREMADLLQIKQGSLSPFLGGTGSPSYVTAYRFAEIAKLPLGFWHQKPEHYPTHVLLAVDTLRETFPALSSVAGAELADAISKAGGVLDPGELAGFAAPILRARFRVNKAIVADNLALDRTADRNVPTARKRRFPSKIPLKRRDVSHQRVDPLTRSRKKAR